MADYIDREELLKKEQIFQQYNSTIKDDDYIRVVTVADIEAQPSVDAVEVVRCRDCKHRYKSSAYEHERCDRLIIPVLDDDFFCKWGEKNEINTR